jgi:hypothetical protein
MKTPLAPGHPQTLDESTDLVGLSPANFILKPLRGLMPRVIPIRPMRDQVRYFRSNSPEHYSTAGF